MSTSVLQDIQTRMQRVADVAEGKREAPRTLTENRRALWQASFMQRAEVREACDVVAASLFAVEQLYAAKSVAADVEPPRTLSECRALLLRAVELSKQCRDDEMRAAIAAVRKTLVAAVAGNPI